MPGLPLAGQASRVVAASTPAPIGGRNARALVSQLAPDEAIRLENWWPEADRVRIRDGYSPFATLAASPCETLFAHEVGPVSRFFAAAGGVVWEITSGTPAVSLAGLVGTDVMATALSANTLIATGYDVPQRYNGSWQACSFTMTGGDPAAIVGVHAHNERLYAWERDSLDFWYGGVGAVGGELTKFPLSELGTVRGSILTIGTWTVDAGNGVQDVLVIVTDAGDVVLYEGTNPSNAYEWRIAGRYRTAQPVGRRCLVNVGPDVVITTREGYVRLSAILRGGEIATNETFALKIKPEVTALANLYAGLPGWQGILDPRGRMLIFGFPYQTVFRQDVMNLSTGAWTLFTGLPARCWGSFGGAIYFGANDGKVYLLDPDADDDAGADIEAVCWQGWQPVGGMGEKRLVTIRPDLIVDRDGTEVEITVLADYRQSGDAVNEGRQVVEIAAEGPAWDVTAWDTSYWGARGPTRDNWPQSGWGERFQLRIEIATRDQRVEWLSTGWQIEPVHRPK